MWQDINDIHGGVLGSVLMAVLLAIVCAFTEANMGVDMRANGMCE
jgi:hypothetical protein